MLVAPGFVLDAKTIVICHSLKFWAFLERCTKEVGSNGDLSTGLA